MLPTTFLIRSKIPSLIHITIYENFAFCKNIKNLGEHLKKYIYVIEKVNCRYKIGTGKQVTKTITYQIITDYCNARKQRNISTSLVHST